MLTVDTPGRLPFALPASTILVVDDSPVNLQVLTRTLHGTGHRILAAKDGKSALEIARRVRPDLMLLDVMMPSLDGFEVCRILKADPVTSEIVVIFLSALGEVSDKVSGLKLGAVDYITKPIQAEEVLARVETHLTRFHLEREVRRSRDQLDHELAAAADMQRAILPVGFPTHPSVEFAASYRTSRHAGGDYYDVLDLGSDRFGIMVADVSGHGARSAIVMAMIRTLLHMHPTPDNPPTVLRHINEHFCYLKETGIFATAIYSVLDLQRRVLRLSCAGHPRPLRVRASGDVETIPVDAVVPLLLMEIDDVPCIEQQLASGDRVLFYTDGITERQASNGSMYEEHRLVSALRSVARLDATAIVDYLVNDVNVFGAGSDPEDDQTLLVTGLMA